MNAISPGNAGAPGLTALIRQAAASGVARRALLVRLDRLPSHRSRSDHLRLLRAALEPLTAADRGQIFNLGGDALVAVWRGGRGVALDQALIAMRQLLGDRRGRGSEAMRQFALPEDGPALLAEMQRPLPPEPGDRASGAAEREVQSFDLETLAAVEAALACADGATFVRRKLICTATPDGRFARAWEKRHLSVAAIAAALSPGCLPQSDPWLFSQLTRTFDRRMLALLACPDELCGAGPFGLNLNVASLLSPEFLRLDAGLPSALRGRVVLHLLASDILADPAAFLFARDFARARGYRLLLRGVTAPLLPVLPLAALGLDYLQLRWSPMVAKPAVRLPAPARIVLAGTDSETALEWGLGQGITLFQGRLARPF